MRTRARSREAVSAPPGDALTAAAPLDLARPARPESDPRRPRRVFRGLAQRLRQAPAAPEFAPFEEAQLPPVRSMPPDLREEQRRDAQAAKDHEACMAAVAEAQRQCAVGRRRVGAGARAEPPPRACAEALERLREVERLLREGDAAGALEAMRHAAEPIGGRRRAGT